MPADAELSCQLGHGVLVLAYDPYSQRERQDVHEIIKWITTQWWSDGRVALIGGSNSAIQALSGAPFAPAALKAIVAGAPASDFYRDILFPGGIRNVNPVFPASRLFVSTLIVASELSHGTEGSPDMECARNFADSPGVGPVLHSIQSEWDQGIVHERSLIRDAASIKAPVFLTAAWQDEGVGSRPVDILRELKVPYHAVLVNGGHGAMFGAMRDKVISFLDHYVKGTGDFDQPPVEIWWDATQSTGVGWKTSHGRWPVPQTKPRRLHLAPGGALADAAPATAGADSLAYLPASGQSTSSGEGWTIPPKPGTYRSYTYEVARDLVVAGSASLDVWLSSTATDTDLQVVIAEVRGEDEIYVAQGFLRASHRELDAKRSSATRPYHTHQAPGAELESTELLRVEIMPFAHAFREGTKLRLYIESPRFADFWMLQSDREPALNTIHRGGATPSALVLAELRGVSPDPRPTACDASARRLCRQPLPLSEVREAGSGLPGGTLLQ